MSFISDDWKKEIEPKRLEYAKNILTDLCIDIHYEDSNKIKFMYKGSEVVFYPFTGWHTGKTIKDGRGLQNLIKQLK